MTDKTYGIAGFGLMGGSFAMALRKEVLGDGGRLFALDPKKAALEYARELGVIDRGFAPQDAADMLAACDVVFICLYPRQTRDFLRTYRAAFKRGSLVTDISGVKGELAHEAAALADADFDFISGHPMAGSEKEGFLHATPAIFHGRNYILLPAAHNKPEHLAFLKKIIYKIGFARVIETDAATHDHTIAFTSQVSHVIAAALVDSAEDTGVTSFGGGSFEDLTRIAMINAPLWSELFLSNRAALISRIETFEQSLAVFKTMLKTENAPALQNALHAVREKRLAM
jgi:prephenate dehydrogenase